MEVVDVTVCDSVPFPLHSFAALALPSRHWRQAVLLVQLEAIAAAMSALSGPSRVAEARVALLAARLDALLGAVHHPAPLTLKQLAKRGPDGVGLTVE